MQDRIRRAILKALVYSDIFDYPLTRDEIWRFLIGERIDRKTFDKFLENSLKEKRIVFKNNFYCLSGREQIFKVKTARKKESQKKIVVAKKIIKRLSRIPTIQFIGISGALSLENSERDDDIDLFVIISRGRLWLTRFAMIVVLLLMGRYRRRNQRQFSDKICLNMLIDESVLSFPIDRQNLYTAHEIVQLLPVFEVNNTYSRFINANKWVVKFLPNALDRIKNHELRIKEGQTKPLSILERLAKALQFWSIKRHQTNETVSDSFPAFHPLDYKKKVLTEYKRRLKQYEI